MTEDDLICGPCALARWLHALDMTVLYPIGPGDRRRDRPGRPADGRLTAPVPGHVNRRPSPPASMTLLNALNQPVPSSHGAAQAVRATDPAQRVGASSPVGLAGRIPSQRTVPTRRQSVAAVELARSDRGCARIRRPARHRTRGRTRQSIAHRMTDSPFAEASTAGRDSRLLWDRLAAHVDGPSATATSQASRALSGTASRCRSSGATVPELVRLASHQQSASQG